VQLDVLWPISCHALAAADVKSVWCVCAYVCVVGFCALDP